MRHFSSFLPFTLLSTPFFSGEGTLHPDKSSRPAPPPLGQTCDLLPPCPCVWAAATFRPREHFLIFSFTTEPPFFPLKSNPVLSFSPIDRRSPCILRYIPLSNRHQSRGAPLRPTDNGRPCRPSPFWSISSSRRPFLFYPTIANGSSPLSFFPPQVPTYHSRLLSRAVPRGTIRSFA